MIFPRALADTLLELARDAAPKECCGLIGVDADGKIAAIWAASNAADSETRYEIEGVEQMRLMALLEERGLTLGAIYHSHVLCPAYPSEMDVATAFYPDVLYVIVGLAEEVVRAFRIVDGQVEEEALEAA